MLRRGVVACLVFAVVMSASLLRAQRAGPNINGPRLRRHAKIGLLEYPAIQAELELTDAQKARLKDADEKLTRHHREIQDRFKALGDAPAPDEVTALREETTAGRNTLLHEIEDTTLKSLDRRQLKRLDQIQIQAEGPTSFMRPEIQQRLNLDPGQIESIREILAASRTELARKTEIPPDLLKKALIPVPGQNSMKIDPRYVDLLKSANQKSQEASSGVRQSVLRRIIKILTKKQRETYEKMRGEPFDFTAAPAAPSPKKAAATR